MESDVYTLPRGPNIPLHGSKGITEVITKYDAHIGNLIYGARDSGTTIY